MVPHLATALTGPINELEQRMLESMPAIERWFRLEWMEHTPPFYASVAVHNAGFKLTPVDTHLFPDGWNHLAPETQQLAVQAAMAAIEKICPEAKNLLLIPKNDTRDPAYQANLARLARIFNLAGLNVRLGSLSPEVNVPVGLALASGERLELEPLLRTPRRLGLKYFDPCTILLNTDLKQGIPGMLEDLSEQYLLPPLHAAWPTRRQHRHFEIYEEVAKRLAKLLGMDVWLIHPASAVCSAADLSAPEGIESLQTQVDAILTKTRRKYKEYGINEKPFAVIKSNQGPAQTDAWTVRDAKDIPVLMAQQSLPHPSDCLVQEGVLTQERIQEAIAEPQVYLMDRYVVGGYYRVHSTVNDQQQFVPLAFDQQAQLPQLGVQPGSSAPNRFYMYGVMARLAVLAASYELEATDPDAEIYD
jgi:glutamate--cysteine ligase